MDKTENLGLKKPSQDDYYNVDDFNYNADVIDAKLKELETPEYTEVIELQELSPGETLGALIGKLAKVVKDFIAHIGNVSNPHKVTKSQIGLGNVNNTSDANKPISTATQKALDGIEDEIDAIPTECFTPQNMIPYPYYDIASGASVTKNGLTLTDNGDGTVTVGAGTATGQIDIRVVYITPGNDSGGTYVENGEKYTLTGCPSGGSGSTYMLWTNYINDSNGWANYGADIGNGLTLTGNGKHMSVTVRIKSGTVISEPITFKPMLVKGSVAQPFTPRSLSSEALRDTKASKDTYGRVKLSDSSAVTDSTGLALPATEKNASIKGTLANQISELTSSLGNLDTRVSWTVNHTVRYGYINTSITFSADGYASVDMSEHIFDYERLISVTPYYSYNLLIYDVKFFLKTGTNEIVITCDALKNKPLDVSFIAVMGYKVQS